MLSEISFNDETIENITMPDYLSESNVSDNLSIISNTDKSCDFNNTLDFTDHLFKDSFCETLKSKHLSNKSLEDKIRNYKKLQNEINYIRAKQNKSRFMLETMDEVFDSDVSKLFKSVKDKCSKKLKYSNLMKTLDDDSGVLGLLSINVPGNEFNLSNEEKSMVHLAFREPFTKKLSELKNEYKFLSDFLARQSSALTLPGSILTEEKASVLNTVEKISTCISSCKDEQMKIINLIDDVYNTWQTKFQELYEREVDCLEKRIKLLELKMKNLNYMIENAIVQQDDKINEAVEILHQELNGTLDKIRYSLEKLKIKKQEYESLKGTKFDDILQEFIELRESYKHKCWALQQLQKAS
ncbi:uncharacterized protein LOC135840831 isoform X2 [Planococcus citri]|uniref:uncharacterized protein LOC135840831 isoform X2 n=1 Tax=Planococcus citri TaxID=170843 RepID=UPI0031F8A3A9